jgi:ecotropic viral integration site 5 protein
MSEEDAFATLVQVMQHFEMRELYKPLMAHVGLLMFQFESMIKVLRHFLVILFLNSSDNFFLLRFSGKLV